MLEVLVTVACCGIKFLKTSIFNPPTPPIHAEFVQTSYMGVCEWFLYKRHFNRICTNPVCNVMVDLMSQSLWERLQKIFEMQLQCPREHELGSWSLNLFKAHSPYQGKLCVEVNHIGSIELKFATETQQEHKAGRSVTPTIDAVTIIIDLGKNCKFLSHDSFQRLSHEAEVSLELMNHAQDSKEEQKAALVIFKRLMRHVRMILLDGAEKEEWEDFASHVAKSPCAKVLDTVEKAQRDLNSPKSLLKLQ